MQPRSFVSKPLGHARNARFKKRIGGLRKLYDSEHNVDWVEDWQVENFNSIWRWAVANVPFYVRWQRIHDLPERISTLADLANFPILTKAHIYNNPSLVEETPGKTGYFSTGGSTGEPVRIPRGSVEGKERTVTNALIRSRAGLAPGDVYVHLWGHSHLFGQGGDAVRVQRNRMIKDWLAGGLRLDAYKRTAAAYAEYAHQIELVNPRYIIGYTSSISAVAAHFLSSANHGRTLVTPNLRAIILTAETVTNADTEAIREAFDAPVFIEYGAAETGVVAFGPADRPLDVFWNRCILQSHADGESIFTGLTQAVFPLIRYSLNDRIRTNCPSHNVQQVDQVLGRTQEHVTLEGANGVLEFNMIGLVQILKEIAPVLSVQGYQASPGRVEVLVTSHKVLDAKTIQVGVVREVARSLPSVSPSSISVVQLAEPIMTMSGKLRIVVDQEEMMTARLVSGT